MRTIKAGIIIGLLWLVCGELAAQFPPFGNQRGPTIKGRVEGVILDSLTGLPLEFATVVLQNAKSGKELDGQVTGQDGGFRLRDVQNGKYQLLVSFLGYENRRISVETTLEKPDLNLGTILLVPVTQLLEEIEVVGEAAFIENRIDKLVYNADKDISNRGGDASDVLRRVPLLSVDLDGNVSLRGSSNIQILINGKPSTLFSSDVANALKAIPADQIKEVEVVTTPTAKYDAEGSAGIINIITKKKEARGLTGSVGGALGTRQNNANANLSWVRGRFGINGSANSFFSWPRGGTNRFYREDYLSDGTTRVLDQSGDATSAVIGYNGSLGAFYDINAFHSISSSGRLRGFNNNRDGLVAAMYTDPMLGVNQIYDRDELARSLNSGFDWTTDYRRSFRQPDRELSLGYQLSGNFNIVKNEFDQTGNEPSLNRNEINDTDGLNLEHIVQLDYVHPFSKAVKLETGAKGTLRRIGTDYLYQNYDPNQGRFVKDPNRSGRFNYDQDVLAGYASVNLQLGKGWAMIAGARYEHTSIAGDTLSEESRFTQEYNNLLPSLIVSKTLPKFQTLKLSFSQRIQRPSLRFINPFLQFSDFRNVYVGNPQLLPELTDQVELNYNVFFKGTVINAGLYYRRTTDVIESILQVDDDGASVTDFRNIGMNNSVGFNLFGSVKPLSFWTLRGGGNIYTYQAQGVINGEEISNEAILWNANLNSSFDLGSGWRIELFGFFNSPRATLQGLNPSFSIFSMGIQKEFSKRTKLGIQIVEPFSEYKSFASELQSDDFYQETDFSILFRSFGLSFSHSFGKLDFQQRQRRSRIGSDDLKQGENQQF